MKNKKLEILSFIFIIVCFIVGGFLGLSLLPKDTIKPIHYISIIVGVALGPTIYLILSTLNKKKNRNIPSVDERTLIIIKRYLLIVLYIVLFGSGAILIVLYSMGIYYIEIAMLIVYLMVLYILIGLGFIVTKYL